MTRKFKLGDKVKLINSNGYTHVKKGDIGIIIKEKHDEVGWLLVKIDGYTKGMKENSNRWELITPASWKERMIEDI
ncbi:MAG: hypothetical protein ACTSQE_17330 [Candidatus Heimdallarchaeaceae archaeon]